MNGSRSIHSRPGERSSFDALNRTIEGLEARLEGLMQSSRDPRRQAAPATADVRTNPASLSVDPLQEIRDRQRMLAGQRERQPGSQPDPVTPASMPRPRLEPRRPAYGSQVTNDPSLREIAEALVELRQELKHDIADGVAREMTALRTDVSSIRSAAQGQPIDDELRSELARLADSINVLGKRGGPATDALRAEYEELHAVIDGLAREESIQRLDSRWQGLEERIVELDTNELREELVGLAYRIDDIKSQLGSMSDSPAIRALEQKLLTVATAMEQLGTRMQPNDSALNSQFALLDERLDEISRAIAASGRAASASTTDHTLQRLENRLGSLAQQIDTMASGTNTGHTDVLSDRIEALSQRIDQLSQEQVSLRLEERLDQLSHMLSTASKPQDLTEYLADISDKIDRLTDGSVNELLAERLDNLARRIDSFSFLGPQSSETDQTAFDRIEDRLSGIAAKLDETARAPASDSAALRDLESQIAHLSTLISQPASNPIATPASREVDDRLASLETYMTTNDEYVLEAARQAAEAVLESFTRQGGGTSGAGVDMSALAALAEDLRHIEELTRNTEERSQHTLNALHRTLVQIADRLDTMEDRIAGPLLHAPAQPAAARQPAPAQSNNSAFALASASETEAEHVHHDLMASLANGTSHAAPAAEPIFGTKGNAPVGEEVNLTGDDTIVAVEEPVTSMARAETGAPKGGLLSQISKRLRPGQKPVAAKTGRTVIDPVPPLAPVDMLPPEQGNEPLEPGSGAPDVRKILERVRASQAAAGNGRAPAKDGDRADYIAAARRAAKAAALETDPAQNARPERVKKAPAANGEAKVSSGSAFARHRRPIMMAVGAVLLALMTLPLVKTLTSGEEAPQAPAISEAPAAEDSSSAVGPADDTNAAVQPQSAPMAPLPEELADPALPERPVTDDAAEIEAIDTAPSSVADAIAAAPPTGEPAVSAEQPAEPRIVVPASIGPKSLADAAEAGDPVALFEIGARYTEGRGVGSDLSEAANWYKLSADRGFAPAQYRIGNLFEKGTGVARDAEKAIGYYRQAAEAGNASAMHNLAVLHASGAIGEPDYAAAVAWFTKAAELGVSDSQFNLAILLARGNGVQQNLTESYKWFAVAAKGGDQDAGEKRDEVAKAMRKEQLDGARAAADSWKPQPLNPDANEVNLPDEWANGKALTTASVDMEKAVLNIQAILNKNGFDAGTPDGKMGQKTVGAIKAFQASIGQEPDGRVNDALVTELLKRNT